MAKTSRKVTQDQGNHIGDIVESMLTEPQFQELRGTGWVLFDDRDVTGSKYAELTGFTTLADARGIGRRAKNNGRSDGNENPDGDLPLGTYQADAFQKHQHPLWTQTASAPGDSGDRMDANAGLHAINATRTSAYSINVAGKNVYEGYAEEGGGGTPKTASETRSKNITVNVFIKIN